MKNFILFVRTLSLALPFILTTAQTSFAQFDPSDFSTLDDAEVASFIRTIAVGVDHRAIMPATPLGSVIGLDVGFEVVAVKLPQDFKSNIAEVGAGTAPNFIPIPRLNIHKGLPAGIDLGVSLIAYDGNTAFGGDIKWAFVNSLVSPSVAIRAGYTKAKVFFMDTSSWKFDLLVSKNLAVIDPYFGVGIQLLSGELVESGTAVLPAGTKKTHSQSATHIFAGLPIKMGLFRMSPEIDYSFVGIANYVLKLSLAF